MNSEERKGLFIEDLLRVRQVYLEGEIDGKTSQDMGRMITWLNAQNSETPITLYINSGGGSVIAGLDIYDIISHSKAPVEGIVFCKANSMAAFILQACRVRKAMTHATIFLHPTKLEVNEELEKFEEAAQENLKAARERQQIIYGIISKRTGMTLDEVMKLCAEKKNLAANQAKEKGLIDEII